MELSRSCSYAGKFSTFVQIWPLFITFFGARACAYTPQILDLGYTMTRYVQGPDFTSFPPIPEQSHINFYAATSDIALAIT
jgi:hypothetical protein